MTMGFWARQTHSLGVLPSVSAYPDLAAAVTKTDAELSEASRCILDELYADELTQARARHEQRVPPGRASDDIARAATLGAVDTALVDIDASAPDFVDEADGALTLDRCDDAANSGIVDEIARRVLMARDASLRCAAQTIPGDGPTAAILRCPL